MSKSVHQISRHWLKRRLKRHFSKSRFLHPIFFSPFILVMNYFHLLALEWLCQQPNVCVVCCSKYCPNTPLTLMYYTVQCTMYTVQCTVLRMGDFRIKLFTCIRNLFQKIFTQYFLGPRRAEKAFIFITGKQTKFFSR